MTRLDLLRKNKKGEREKTRIITNYNPYNPNLQRILHGYEGLLLTTRKEAIRPNDIHVTYSRSSNLRDIHIKQSLQQTTQIRGCQPCGKQCKTCEHIIPTSEIFGNNNIFKIRGNFNCQSNNVVNVLTCTICNTNYVGETENTLNTRCRGHESNMRNIKDNPLSHHYRSYNHI